MASIDLQIYKLALSFLILADVLSHVNGKRVLGQRKRLGNATNYSLVSESSKPSNEDEERLAIDMFKGYNSLIRPSPCHNSSVIFVEFGVAMILLINVDEKNQIMQTNVWLTLKWNDCQFSWNPGDYGGLESMRVPQDRVWVPDIVLFNNADGNYEVSYHSNVVVDYLGNVTWVPPAIYKSSCRIDVEFFPFDEQTCALIFGSWTYTRDEVKLKWYNNKQSVELEDYSPSGVWDVMDVPGELIHEKSKIAFQIRIRRKTLFYTVILIIPTVLMAFLSMLVFYLPAECAEKITLSISILLALVVFLLLVSKILPPTSDTIPLMAKYLLLTFILNILTIMATVIIINVYFRSATTHVMPKCVRHIFLKFLPTILMMKRPERIPIFNGYFVEEYCVEEIFDASLIMSSITATTLPFSLIGNRKRNDPRFPGSHHRNCTRSRQRFFTKRKSGASPDIGGKVATSKAKLGARYKFPSEEDSLLMSPVASFRKPLSSTTIASSSTFTPSSMRRESAFSLSGISQHNRTPKKSSAAVAEVFSGRYTFGPKAKSVDTADMKSSYTETPRENAERAEFGHEQRISEELKSAVESIAYIAEHMKAEMTYKKVRDDWKYVAMVIDRLLLIIFFGITMGGTVGIIFSSPYVFDFVDQHQIIERLIAQSKSQAAAGKNF